MLLGCCAPVEAAQAAKEAGFDFLECRLTSLLGDEDDSAFAPVLAVYRAAALPVLAFNVFLPADLAVVGPAVDWARVERYVANSVRRAALVGARVLVFGSGRSRHVPDGFDRAAAEAQLVRVLRLAAEAAGPEGPVIAIEPLNGKESNILNSVAEAAALARRVGHPKVRVLADFYHMDEEQEPLDHLLEFRDLLAHVHVADTGRRAPGTGQYPYARFAALLRQAGYGGMVSVECRWDDFATQASAAVRFLRQVLGE